MINNVTIVGRLTRDAELRYTGSGNAVTSFTIAADRPFKNNQGNRDADFINCVAWRRTAETITNFTKKGSLVGVTGRIQTRSYENNEGRTVFVTEVVVENFQMLEPKSVTDSRRSDDSQGNQNYNQNQSFNTQNSGTFNQNQNNSFNNSGFSQNNNNDPFEKDDDSIHITDDDLPF